MLWSPGSGQILWSLGPSGPEDRKKGTVLGPAINIRIGIQLQGENRQVSIWIFNLRYWEGPEQNCQTLYDKVVCKAQVQIDFLREEIQMQIKKAGNKHIETALARYNLGRALWLSNKPLETTQAVEEFEAAILFMTQRKPRHHNLKETEKTRDRALETIVLFRTPDTLSAWPYWKPPTARWEDKREMTELFENSWPWRGEDRWPQSPQVQCNTNYAATVYTTSAVPHYS